MKSILSNLASIADAADEAGMRKAANAVDAILAGKESVRSEKAMRVLAKLRDEAGADGRDGLSKSAAGFMDWLKGLGKAHKDEKKPDDAKITNDHERPAEALIQQMYQSGAVKQYRDFVAGYKGRKRISLEDAKQVFGPAMEFLKKYYMLARSAELSLPSLPNLDMFKRGFSGKVKLGRKDLVAFGAELDKYITTWTSDTSTSSIDKALEAAKQQKSEPPKPEQPAAPPPTPEPARAAAPKAPPKPEDPQAPYSDIPESERKPGQKKMREYWSKPGTPYFHGKPRLASPVIQAIRQHIMDLPVELRGKAKELEDFFREQGGFAKAAATMEGVYQQRKDNLLDLFHRFFGASAPQAQAFINKVMQSVQQAWDREFVDIDAELLRMDKEGKNFDQMSQELEKLTGSKFEPVSLKGMMEKLKPSDATAPVAVPEPPMDPAKAKPPVEVPVDKVDPAHALALDNYIRREREAGVDYDTIKSDLEVMWKERGLPLWMVWEAVHKHKQAEEAKVAPPVPPAPPGTPPPPGAPIWKTVQPMPLDAASYLHDYISFYRGKVPPASFDTIESELEVLWKQRGWDPSEMKHMIGGAIKRWQDENKWMNPIPPHAQSPTPPPPAEDVKKENEAFKKPRPSGPPIGTFNM
jgi:hypothetical protein